jgi:hypothetical protein
VLYATFVKALGLRDEDLAFSTDDKFPQKKKN